MAKKIRPRPVRNPGPGAPGIAILDASGRPLPPTTRELIPKDKVYPSHLVSVVDRGLQTDITAVIKYPTDVLEAVAAYIGDRNNEFHVILFVDFRDRLIGYTYHTSGAMGMTSTNIGGIFREALIAGAAAMFCAHQHPGADPTPSPPDRRLWEGIAMAAQILSVPVTDNIIIGDDSYFSETAELREMNARKLIMEYKSGLTYAQLEQKYGLTNAELLEKMNYRPSKYSTGKPGFFKYPFPIPKGARVPRNVAP
jgi:hypothetical protein